MFDVVNNRKVYIFPGHQSGCSNAEAFFKEYRNTNPTILLVNVGNEGNNPTDPGFSFSF